METNNELFVEFDVPETDWHTEDMCDKCQKKVGIENLKPVPFLYKNMDDKFHPDLGNGYRQYYVCKECMKKC